MKSKSGITLIALVIAIIILIIFTGISLNLAIGDDGLISKTGKAANKYNKDQSYEELYSLILEAQTEDIRTEPTIKSVLKYLLEKDEDVYIIRTESEIDDPEGESIVEDIDNLEDDINSVFIVYKGHEFELDKSLNLHKNKQLANADENTSTNNTSNNNTNTTNTTSGGNSEPEQPQSQYTPFGEIYTTSTADSSARISITINSPYSANVPANQSSQSNATGENILYTTVNGSGNARNFGYFSLYYAGYGNGGWMITSTQDNIYYSESSDENSSKTKLNQINWEYNISKDYYIYTLDDGNYTLRKEIKTASTGGNDAALNVTDLQSSSEQEEAEISDYSVEINHYTAGTAQNYYYFSVSYSSLNWRVCPLNNFSNIYFTTTATPQESDYTQLTNSNLYWPYTATNHYYLFLKNE